MKLNRTRIAAQRLAHFALTPLCLLLATTAAQATNGYFAHGYGIKAKGMAGASTALAQDSMGGATNPAAMVWVGNRVDVGADVFMPKRDAVRSGAGFPTLNGGVESGREAFLIPEFGYNRAMGDMSLGVTVYGNGGMNTSYPQGNFNCGGPPANMLCGGGMLDDGIQDHGWTALGQTNGRHRTGEGAAEKNRYTPPKVARSKVAHTPRGKLWSVQKVVVAT